MPLFLGRGQCWCQGELPTIPHLWLQVPHAPSQPLASSESRRFTNKHSKKALKASLTLGILLGMFFVAWLPFFVTNVVQVRACGGLMAAFQKFSLWNLAGFNWRHLKDQGCNSPGSNSKEKTLPKGFEGFFCKGSVGVPGRSLWAGAGVGGC